ncbi:MAG: peptidylprolyl isomerase [Sphingomonas bacterium]|nr:peptidylprolyl isomerase [Sphingomonas bacterium]
MVIATKIMTAHQRKLALLGTLGLALAGAAVAHAAAPRQPANRTTSKTTATKAPAIKAATAKAPATKAPTTKVAPNSASSLRLPENPKVFGSPLPQIVKATAIVNGEVITQTDIDQRIALLAIASGQAVPDAEVERLRQQVLRNLIDETLQIQAAKAEEILVKPADIDRTVARVAGNVKQTPDQMAGYLTANGSSIRTIRRQIEGEIAWRRLQSAKIESGVSVGDDEVKAVIDKLEAAKGSDEFRIGEIFLSATPVNRDEVLGNATKIIAALQKGASFAGYARQYSEASTAAVGGDLGWVRPEQLPEAIGTVVRQMATNSLSAPIAVPGGFSVVALLDKRKVLTADPRAAVLNLKQVSIKVPAGMALPAANAMVARFAAAALSLGGCGGAEKLAADFKGEVVQSDEVALKELPAALQDMMLPMQVGQATRPFGSIEDGVRVLVMCGRDEPSSNAPTFDQVYSQLNEERINTRARRYLRDLRRDAVIDFR